MATELPYKELGETVLHQDSTWILTMFMIAILVIGYIRSHSATFIHQLLSLTTSSFNWHSVEDAISLHERWTCRILYGVYFISLSLLIYEIITAFGYGNATHLSGLALYGIIALLCIGFYLIQYIARAVVGYAFDIPNTIHSIWLCKILFANIMSIIALPVVIIFPFSPEHNYPILTIIAILLFTLMYIWRILHSFRLIISDFLSLFYTILYLCAVEAVPMVIIAKILTQGSV